MSVKLYKHQMYALGTVSSKKNSAFYLDMG